MKIDTVNKTSFGWNKATHLEMTMLALQDFALPSVEKRQLARFSQMPDLMKSEAGFFHNTHFYFPDSKKQSYGFKSSENAYRQFNKHVIDSLNPLDSEDFLRNAGYAIHFLQDVSMPMHTESGGILQKMRDYYLHKNFERGEKYGTAQNIKELIAEYEPESLNTEDVRKIFLDTARFSSRFKVSRFNKKDWIKIQHLCFNRGVDATRAFFKSISKKVNL